MIEVLNKHNNPKSSQKSDILFTYKKLEYLRSQGLKWGEEKLNDVDVLAWQALLNDDHEALQMDTAAGFYLQNTMNPSDLLIEAERTPKNIMHGSLKSISGIDRLKYLRIFGFLPGSESVTSEELDHWENLVEIDHEAALLDSFAEHKVTHS